MNHLEQYLDSQLFYETEYFFYAFLLRHSSKLYLTQVLAHQAYNFFSQHFYLFNIVSNTGLRFLYLHIAYLFSDISVILNVIN